MMNTCDYLCLMLATTALLITGCQGHCINHGVMKRYVTKSGTYMTSPGYFENGTYPPNSHCQWFFEAIDGGALYLYVDKMDLGGLISSNCTSGDRVLIYNGYTSSFSPLLARLCRRRDEGRHFYSTGRFFFVEFLSDEWFSGTGFRLQLKSVYRYPVTTTSTTEKTLHGSSETRASSLSSMVYLTIALGAVLSFTCLIYLCRCGIDRCCPADSSRNPRHPFRNHAHDARNPAQFAINPAHYDQNHAPSAPPANQQVRNGPVQQNGGWNNTHSSLGDSVSSAVNGGHVNTGYSNFGEAPPPYEEVVDSRNGSGQRETLPSYSEAIQMSDIAPKLDTADN